MPTRDATPAGAPCWVDLSTTDTQRARHFYGRVLGWTAEEPAEEFGGYFNFSKDGALVAGCMASQPDAGVTDVWSVYLATDDIDKTLEATVSHDGQVHVPAMAVGDLGSMALIADPGNAAVGVWQPGRHKGFGIVAEPGAPSWFELHTRHYRQVLDFYRDVFGWDTHVMSDKDEFRYTTLGEGADALAGVMDATDMLPGDVPPHWAVYFGVEDADAALATVVDLGGTVTMDAEDTPYGRIGAAADPMGAQFLLVAANEAMPARTD